MIPFKSIYVAQARSDAVKIGSSDDPGARMAALSVDSREPVRLLQQSETFADWSN
jgi:hypothetical protein